jgi:hypothetical protein
MATMEARATRADPVRGAAFQAYWLLRVGFTVAPILFGIDKFFNWTVHWPDYLAGWINDIVPAPPRTSCTSSGASRSLPA